MSITMIKVFLSATILFLAIVGIRKLFREKVGNGFIYSLWLIFAMDLFVSGVYLAGQDTFDWNLYPIHSSFSVMNLVDVFSQESQRDVSSFQNGESAVNQTEYMGENPNKNSGQNSTKGIGNVSGKKESTSGQREETLTAGMVKHPDGVSMKWDWRKILFGIWIGGAVFLFILQILFERRFRKQLVENRQETDYQGQKLYVAKGIATPLLFRSRGISLDIYIPEMIMDDEDVVKHAILHENTHKKHGDIWWSYVRNILVALYWFYPPVWIAAVMSKRDCELACDSSLMRGMNQKEKISYGNSLLSLVEVGKKENVFSTATAMKIGKSEMEVRIKMIKNGKQKKKLAVLLVCLFLCGAGIVAYTDAGGTGKVDETTQSPSEKNSYTEVANTESELKNAEWQKCCVAFLEEVFKNKDKEDVIEFAIKDLDNNGISEIIIAKNGVDISVYTFDSQVHKAGNCNYGGTTRLFFSNNSSYPGIFYFYTGGGLEHHGYMTIKENSLVKEELWNYDFSGISEQIGEERNKTLEISSDKQLIDESKEVYSQNKDLLFEELNLKNIEHVKNMFDISQDIKSDEDEQGNNVPVKEAEYKITDLWGADTPQIYYEDNARMIFAGYFGLFIYSKPEEKIVQSLDLKYIGCDHTQGDNYCEIQVSADGTQVYLHVINDETMYQYSVDTNQLRHMKYELPGDLYTRPEEDEPNQGRINLCAATIGDLSYRYADANGEYFHNVPLFYAPYGSCDFFGPEDIHDICEISFYLCGKEYVIKDAEKLKWIEEHFSNPVEEIKGSTECTFYNVMYLERKDGTIGKMYPAMDSCAIYWTWGVRSDDYVYYKYDEGTYDTFWKLFGIDSIDKASVGE